MRTLGCMHLNCCFSAPEGSGNSNVSKTRTSSEEDGCPPPLHQICRQNLAAVGQKKEGEKRGGEERREKRAEKERQGRNGERTNKERIKKRGLL